MKKTLLCLLFLFTNFFYAQVSDIEHCAGNTSFDLTSQKTLLIGNLNPDETTVSYHLSLSDATDNTNAIENPANYVSNVSSKTIYARIDNLGKVTTNYFNVILHSEIISSLVVQQISCQNEKGKIMVESTGGKGPYTYSINYGNSFTSSNVFTDLVEGVHTIITKDVLGCEAKWIVSGVIEPYKPLEATCVMTNVTCNGNSDGSISINATGGRSPYTYSLDGGATFFSTNVFSNLATGIYNIAIKDDNGCLVNYIISITEPAVLHATFTVENQTIKINTTGGNGSYMYAVSPYLDEFYTDNIFSNLSPGIYTVLILDENGCYLIKEISIDPTAPLKNGKNAINFDFTPGQTLGDIVVDGQNIKWYSSPNSLSGKTSKSTETTLPLTTVLVDGVTYYASQTINGIESTQRLAVTAKSNGSLSNPDFVLPNFKFYPNPVQQNLSINNTEIIDEIEIFSLSGKSVLAKKINNLHAEIDLSGVSTGVYFLKVKSEGTTKSIKIVKE